MSETQKDRVIILRTIKHGESDLIVHGLNSSGARLNLIAKGALRSRKRFGGGTLEPANYIFANYQQNRKNNSEEALQILTEAQLIDGFNGLRKNYERLELAFYFLQVMAKVSQEGVIDAKENFDLLGNALKAAETSDDPDFLKTHFELKILLQQGILPEEIPNKDWLKWPISRYGEYKINKQDYIYLRLQTHSALNSYLMARSFSKE